MSDILATIKRAIITRQYAFSFKAEMEIIQDGITKLEVLESIMSAVAIYKKLRSRSPLRSRPVEYLYVIMGTTYSGLPIYTKGKFMRKEGKDIFYFLISSKRAL